MRFSAPTDTDTETVSSTSSTPTRASHGTTTYGRKIPECRTCGTPMRGHKRNQAGTPICPSLPSPSPSPERPRKDSVKNARRPTTPQPKQQAAQGSPLQRSPGMYIPYQYGPESPLRRNLSPEPSLQIPNKGPFHWVNPHFRKYVLTPKREALSRTLSEVPSEVPTVLCDEDGNTIYDGEQSERSVAQRLLRSESTETATPSPMSRVNSWLNNPALTLYKTHGSQIDAIQSTAHQLGVHTAVVPASQTPNPVGSEGSLWLLIGKEPAFVRQMMDSFQKSMPGGYNDGVVDVAATGPRPVSFLQLIIAAVLGGCIVVIGMAYIV